MGWEVVAADCVGAMAGMDECSVDAVVTDPPYHLSFMSKAWDHVPSPAESQQMHERWAVEALRILKPGGHLVAAGGSRTYHRLVCAIEDAGFEIRDCITHLYGSGFPKSLNVSAAIDKAAGVEREVVGTKRGTMAAPETGRTDMPGKATGVPQTGVDVDITVPATPEAERWDGWGTALKPAAEFWTVARKPLSGTVAQTVLEHGTGAVNVDGCRVVGTPGDGRWGRGVEAPDRAPFKSGSEAMQPAEVNVAGRWPANVVLDEVAAGLLDQQSGERPPTGRSTMDPAVSGGMFGFGGGDRTTNQHYDSGGASRFFFTAQRHTMEGCEPAPNAEPSSSPDGQVLGSVPSGAATEGHREDSTLTGPTRSQEPTTSGTPIGSSESAASGTPTTPNTDSESSPASPPTKPTPSGSPASGAEPPRPTDTTTTIPDPSTSAGSAGPATSEDTQPTTAPGVPALPIDSGETRFRYTAKASRSERNAGLEGFEAKPVRPSGAKFGEQTMWNGENGDEAWRAKNPNNPAANVHPTVKPIALMRWLVRLVTPPGGTVLDPFAGSGTTGCAAVLEGFDFIGVEREPEYVEIARARIAYWADSAAHEARVAEAERLADIAEAVEEGRPYQPSLFD